MEFKSPRKSAAHLALINAVDSAGLDTAALRDLLWLINAHPALAAHAQVFEHALAHFGSAIFLPRNLTWASAWKDGVPKWIQLCEWIVKNRRKLIHSPGLVEFDLRRDERHPHLNKGVGRHAVVAALWNRHNASKHFPPTSGIDPNAALRYFELQGHLLASYADARFKLSSRELYETYDGELERPVAPIRTQSVGLAIRDLSLNKYARVIESLPSFDSTAQFAANIVSFRINNQLRWAPENANIREDIDRHLAVLKRYFERFSYVLNGGIPAQTHKAGGAGGGGGGSGGKAHRHGFINIPGPVGVYLDELSSQQNDPDLVEPPGQAILVNLGWAKYPKSPSEVAARASALEMEASGLSPAESLEETLRLYSPAEYKGRVREMYYQRLAAESAAQGLAFDYSQLTWTEISTISKRALDWADGNSSGLPPGIGSCSETVGIIVSLMLFLGQPVQQAWSIQCFWRNPDTPLEHVKPVNGKITLIICAPEHGDWNNAVVDGFCFPGLSPAYKTDLPEGLEDIDADCVDFFVLPDVLGIGQRTLRYLRQNSITDAEGFGMGIESTRKAVTDFCKSFSNPRITAEKIARVLASIVTSKTGDQSLAWILTADARKANQTRMFYTRHNVDRLLSAYLRAAKDLSKATKITLVWTPNQTSHTTISPGVGTRFITSISEVRNLIESLREDLAEEIPNDADEAFFRWYHNTFVIYTHLHQSLDTSLRAISAPNDLFRIATKSVLDYGIACACLSDKDTAYSSKSRLVPIRKPLQKQFESYDKHLDCLGVHIKSARLDIENARNISPFFFFDTDRTIKDLTPTVFEMALKRHTGQDMPANFHRGFLRSQLLGRGCPAEVVDAHLGHANFGESPFTRLSTFDYGLHLDQIARALQEIHDDIGLRPIESRIAFKRLQRSKS